MSPTQNILQQTVQAQAHKKAEDAGEAPGTSVNQQASGAQRVNRQRALTRPQLLGLDRRGVVGSDEARGPSAGPRAMERPAHDPLSLVVLGCVATDTTTPPGSNLVLGLAAASGCCCGASLASPRARPPSLTSSTSAWQGQQPGLGPTAGPNFVAGRPLGG